MPFSLYQPSPFIVVFLRYTAFSVPRRIHIRFPRTVPVAVPFPVFDSGFAAIGRRYLFYPPYRVIFVPVRVPQPVRARLKPPQLAVAPAAFASVRPSRLYYVPVPVVLVPRFVPVSVPHAFRPAISVVLVRRRCPPLLAVYPFAYFRHSPLFIVRVPYLLSIRVRFACQVFRSLLICVTRFTPLRVPHLYHFAVSIVFI